MISNGCCFFFHRNINIGGMLDPAAEKHISAVILVPGSVELNTPTWSFISNYFRKLFGNHGNAHVITVENSRGI